MNNLTKTLLGGAAICALGVAPAAAQQKHPPFRFVAMHSGRVVNKTKVHNNGVTHNTYTFGVYTYVPASDYRKKVNLIHTFYKWNSYSTICSDPKQSIKLDRKKTKYAKLGTTTEAYSLGCASGPTTFYGDTYKLTEQLALGRTQATDFFLSTLKGKFKNNQGTYKGTLPINVTVYIESE